MVTSSKCLPSSVEYPELIKVDIKNYSRCSTLGKNKDEIWYFYQRYNAKFLQGLSVMFLSINVFADKFIDSKSKCISCLFPNCGKQYGGDCKVELTRTHIQNHASAISKEMTTHKLYQYYSKLRVPILFGEKPAPSTVNAKLTHLQLCLIRVVCALNLAINILEYDEFHDLIAAARKAPRELLPRSTKFKVLLHEYAKEVSDDIKIQMAVALGVSLAFDIWTKFSNSYIGIRSHCIMPGFIRKSFCLGVYIFNESKHTGKAVAQKVKVITEEFISWACIAGLTHDSASNNTAKTFIEETMGKIRVKCVGHKMSLATKLMYKSCPFANTVLKIAKRLSKLFHKSSVARDALYVAQQNAGREPRLPPTASETRFNGGYLVISGLLSMKADVNAALEHLYANEKATYKNIKTYIKNVTPTRDYQPTLDDWSILQQLSTLLKPVQDHFFIPMQGKNVLLSDAVMWYQYLQLKLPSNVENVYVSDLRTAMQHYFQEMIHEDSIFVACLALDPRTTRNTLITERTWFNITKEAKALYIFENSRQQLDDPALETAEIIHTAASKPHLKHQDNEDPAWLQILNGASESSVQQLKSHAPPYPDLDGRICVEISKLREFYSTTVLTHTADALRWWSTYVDFEEFPIISKYAASVFSIAPTELENERDFSQTGCICYQMSLIDES